MSFISSLRPGGRHGLSSRETRDAIGLAVAVVNRLAQSDLIDRVGLRKQAEQAVYSTTRNGFRVATAAGRTFARAGRRTPGARPAHAPSAGVFDLTPTEDEAMLLEVVRELATEVLRPAAPAADAACAPPAEVLGAAQDIGLPALGVAEQRIRPDPSMTKPSPSRRAVVARSNGSKSTLGSASVSAAAGALDPSAVKAGR